MTAERARPSRDAARARRLLAVAAVGGHTGAAVCVVAFWAVRGPLSALSAAVAAVVTLAFNVIGQAVQVLVADAKPESILIASLGSYALRVGVLGVLLAAVLAGADRFDWLDPVAVVWGTIAVVVCWLTAEFWAYSRLRIPVFDSPSDRG